MQALCTVSVPSTPPQPPVNGKALSAYLAAEQPQHSLVIAAVLSQWKASNTSNHTAAPCCCTWSQIIPILPDALVKYAEDLELIFFPISARSKAEREGGREERGCVSARVREASLLGTGNKRDECTRAGAQCCSHRNLPNDSTISLPGCCCILLLEGSKQILQPASKEQSAWHANLIRAATSWAAASIMAKINAGGFRFQVLSSFLPLLSSA